ncbi:MAG: hypothetical protein AAB775_01825, partial [Patescibacteria group bacterium]
MSNTFAMSQGAGQKLEFAFQRNDGTTSDLDWLSTGENLKSVILLARGEAELTLKVKSVPTPIQEPIINLIIRIVHPDRNRTPKAVLTATGRKQYTSSDVVAGMPRGTGEEAKVVFFKLGRWISDVDLDKEYKSRGLKPADPYSLAAVNE